MAHCRRSKAATAAVLAAAVVACSASTATAAAFGGPGGGFGSRAFGTAASSASRRVGGSSSGSSSAMSNRLSPLKMAAEGDEKPKKRAKKRAKGAKSKKAKRTKVAAAAAPAPVAMEAEAGGGGTAVATKPVAPPSTVSDFDGPTPEKAPFIPDLVDASEIQDMAAYDPAIHPIPHQPWRRGETRGCEEAVDAPWRLEAEHEIEQAARRAGASVEGITWYLTFVVVALSNDLSQVLVDDLEKAASGIDIEVDTTRPETNIWTDGPDDQDDPAGAPVGTYHDEEHMRVGSSWSDDDDEETGAPQYDEETGELLPRPLKDTRGEAVFKYQKARMERLKARQERKQMMKLPGLLMPRNLNDAGKLQYDGFQKGLDDYGAVLAERYGDVANMTSDELDGALNVYNAYMWHMDEDKLDEFKTYLLEKFEPLEKNEGVDVDIYDTDVRGDGITDAYAERLAKVADAIVTRLGEEEIDYRLDILDRHEVVLTSANFDGRIVETQREFDSQRGNDVFVQTRDPWNSNRVLKGKLVDRNVLDVVINADGRMVTIPNNMIGYVYLPEKHLESKLEFEIMTAMEMEELFAAEEAENAAEYDEEEYEEGEWEEGDEEGEGEWVYEDEE